MIALRGLTHIKARLLNWLKCVPMIIVQILLSGLGGSTNSVTNLESAEMGNKKNSFSCTNDDPLYYTGKLRDLAHCKACSDPMFIIYDQSLRDYCAECEAEISGDNNGLPKTT